MHFYFQPSATDSVSGERSPVNTIMMPSALMHTQSISLRRTLDMGATVKHFQVKEDALCPTINRWTDVGPRLPGTGTMFALDSIPIFL